jgi:sulfatase maturation enzyme AslB (radical SAM superfamily)
MTTAPERTAPPDVPRILELEVTGACQLSCSHCYAASGPQGTHGSMSAEDWRRVISDAAVLGVKKVQLIGGEALLNPASLDLLHHAQGRNLDVEVYSNLFVVPSDWWTALSAPGVSLATSYYSDDPAEHDRITQRPGSHARTRANIINAVHLRIPLRVSIIDVINGQRIDQARAELQQIGVREIRTDRVRHVGRGASDPGTPQTTELCGTCAHGKAAVLPDGQVVPCVTARWMDTGNVHDESLSAILRGDRWASAVSAIPTPRAGNCAPDSDSCCPAMDVMPPPGATAPTAAPRGEHREEAV